MMSLSLGLGLTAGGSAASYLAETLTWAAALTTPPTDARKALVNTLIAGLQTDNIWNSLDWLLLCAAESEQAGRVNVKTPSKVAANVNSCTFTTDRGFTGDAISMHISLGEALNASSNYTQDSACWGIWCNGVTGSGLIPHIGTSNGSRAFLNARDTAGNETFQINDGTGDTLQANTGSRLGHRAASRTAADVKRGFFNGVRVANITRPSISASSTTQFIHRNATTYGSDRAGAFYSGGGLDDTAMGKLHTRLNTFLTAIGAN